MVVPANGVAALLMIRGINNAKTTSFSISCSKNPMQWREHFAQKQNGQPARTLFDHFPNPIFENTAHQSFHNTSFEYLRGLALNDVDNVIDGDDSLDMPLFVDHRPKPSCVCEKRRSLPLIEIFRQSDEMVSITWLTNRSGGDNNNHEMKRPSNCRRIDHIGIKMFQSACALGVRR